MDEEAAPFATDSVALDSSGWMVVDLGRGGGSRA
jgi:hypothetical protein